MVDALASDRSDQPFGEAVLPRRAWGDGLVADAHGAQSVRDGSAIDAIQITDQVARRLRVDLGPASKGAGFPTPVMAKAGPMPTHQDLRSDDNDGPEHRWKPSIQQDQEQAIPICELDATPHPALQHNQLMTERRVLGLKSALRLERRDGQGQKEAEERDHRRSS